MIPKSLLLFCRVFSIKMLTPSTYDPKRNYHSDETHSSGQEDARPIRKVTR